jgi:hypothetical protein
MERKIDFVGVVADNADSQQHPLDPTNKDFAFLGRGREQRVLDPLLAAGRHVPCGCHSGMLAMLDATGVPGGSPVGHLYMSDLYAFGAVAARTGAQDSSTEGRAATSTRGGLIRWSRLRPPSAISRTSLWTCSGGCLS